MVKVLVVDDDPAPLRLLTQVINMLGYLARSAANRTEALAIAGEFQPDVLLSDWLLEDHTGLDVALAVRAVAPHVRTVFISGYPAETIADQARLISRFPVLQKPLGIDAIESALRRVLEEDTSPLEP